MPDELESCVNTGGSNTYLLSKGTVVYVNAAGKQPMFTIYTAGGGRPGTGESITSSFDVFVENVTCISGRNDLRRLDISDDR
ncbi:MAG: hypothetical protein ACYTBV_18750 [Planctomycetota bacterium]|jgi:hypothetical protein